MPATSSTPPKPETIVPVLPGYAQLRGGGHWTRDVAFLLDAKRMWISVGSGSNVDDADTHPNQFHRAYILEYTPEGKFVMVYASGLRNCVGEAVNPITGQRWCSTNERDALGNNLVPDYITSVPENGFFGWPWYYMGGHQDPRLPKPCANGTGPNPQLSAPLTAAQAAGVQTGPPLRQGPYARRDSSAPLRLAGDALDPPEARPRRIPGSIAAMASPPSTEAGTARTAPYQRLQIPHPHARRPCHRRVRYRLPHRLRASRATRKGRGPSGGRRRRQRRIALRLEGHHFSKTVWHVSYSGK